MKNLLISTDAYKGCHFQLLPKDAEASRFYIAPRKQLSATINEFIVFGITYFVETYLSQRITMSDMAKAKRIWDTFNVLGKKYPFPEAGFLKIINHYRGKLPINIYGVKEGSVQNTYNKPVVIIECNDPDLVWLPGWLETSLQRSVWYPSTVGTLSRNIKVMLKGLYEKAVNPEDFWTLDYRLHDFGARGATSGESAALGGLAHLINFKGTDTMEAVDLGNELYGIPVQELACSVRASEHSTVTAFGKGMGAETEALIQMIDSLDENDSLFAFVSDTYDYRRLVKEVWCNPEMIEKIRKTGKMACIRPDSGNYIDEPMFALRECEKAWGYTLNKKGFKVLNGINVIQGDGMNPEKITELYSAAAKEGFSPQNLAVGMGGGLLQNVSRDDMSWSEKMYQIKRTGIWQNVQKDPATQKNKKGWNPAEPFDTSNWVTYYLGDPKTKLFNLPEATMDFNEIRENAKV